MSKHITVDHNGKTYGGQLAVIKSTSLGYEDHGILTVFIHTAWPGGGVGVGGYALDVYDESLDQRVPSAYGLDQVVQIMATVGVDVWEKLVGEQVIVLFEGGSWPGSRSVGIASALDDKVFILSEHAAEWKSRTEQVSA